MEGMETAVRTWGRQEEQVASCEKREWPHGGPDPGASRGEGRRGGL
jgi:hypothetical protein